MKIALVIFTAYGAANQYTALLANSLALKGNTVTVFAPSDADESHYDRSIKLVKLPLPGGLIKTILKCFDPAFIKYWNESIAAAGPDIVHIVFEQRFPFFYLPGLKRDFPVVTTIHEPMAIPNRSFIANKVVAVLQFINNHQLANLADHINIHSDKLRSARIFSPNMQGKISVIPVGNFSFLSHDLPGIQTTRDNLLFFGRIVAYKGLKYLIQAAKKVKPVIPGLTVTIAGEGDFSGYQDMIKGEDYFTVLNHYIPDDKAAELFQKASAVVLPYIGGSQTGIISIASEFRKPVIASNVGNFSEMLTDGETGILIPAADVNALEKAICKLLQDDDLRKRIGEAAHNIISQKYSWTTISGQILETYKTAIRDHNNNATK